MRVFSVFGSIFRCVHSLGVNHGHDNDSLYNIDIAH
jgi:hypothetical protein